MMDERIALEPMILEQASLIARCGGEASVARQALRDVALAAAARADADAATLRAALTQIVEFEPLKSAWDGWRHYHALRHIADTALMSVADRTGGTTEGDAMTDSREHAELRSAALAVVTRIRSVYREDYIELCIAHEPESLLGLIGRLESVIAAAAATPSRPGCD